MKDKITDYNHTQQELCPHCHGFGYIADSSYIPKGILVCPICNGKRVLVKVVKYDLPKDDWR